MADRRRSCASQDTDEEDDEVPRSEVAVVSSSPCILDLSGVQARELESECESEDWIEGDAVVLSDYESAEEYGSQKSEEDGEEYSDEEIPKEVTKKSSKEGNEDELSKEGKSEEKRKITGERQSGDGQTYSTRKGPSTPRARATQLTNPVSYEGWEEAGAPRGNPCRYREKESTEPVEDKMGKKNRQQLDDDEDRKNPAYIPRKGLFFEHDLRGHTEPEEVRPKVRQRKLWKDEGRWVHDKFQEDEQAPKSRDELISLYGYDIRSDRNPDEIRPRRIRKPRFRNHQIQDRDSLDEPPYLCKSTNSIPPERTFKKRMGGPEWKSLAKSYSKIISYNEDHENVNPFEINSSRSYHFSELSSSKNKMDAKNADHMIETVKSNGETREDGFIQNQSLPTENVPQIIEKTKEKKSYSRIRRTRSKVPELEKSVDDTPITGLVAPPQQISIQPVPTPTSKAGSWETSPVDSPVSGIECGMSQINLSGENWTPNSQSQYVHPRELGGIPSVIHITASAQYNRVEKMGNQARRAKRYSSQRQRPVHEEPRPPPPTLAPALGPTPAPGPTPMHIGLVEGHYYDMLQFQEQIYTHSENPAPLPPQGMIVQMDMHLPHPGFNHHQSPGHLTNTGLYAPQVTLPSGQPPPPQVLPSPFFTPRMMNYENPSYPYPTGGLPPHIYLITQAQTQVFGGVTYYNTVQQQVLPKPSPARRQLQPVTVKPPPPEQLFCIESYG